MRAVIFGAGGQDGYYLKRLLPERNIEAIGVSRTGRESVQGDVGDFGFVETLIRVNKPDYVFHFAANSSTRHDVMFENHVAISTGTLNILESVKRHSPASNVFLAGSAMQFKNAGLPIDESTEFHAGSPYAFSRIQSVYAARYYRERFGLSVYIGYLFNHDSPLREEHHVNQKIVTAVHAVKMGQTGKLVLGNIEVRKEFNFSGDIVEAIWCLVNQRDCYEAVLGSGVAYSIREWVDYCFKAIGKNWEDYVVLDAGFVPEYKILVSAPAKIRRLGWTPQVSFMELADMMMKGIDHRLLPSH